MFKELNAPSFLRQILDFSLDEIFEAPRKHFGPRSKKLEMSLRLTLMRLSRQVKVFGCCDFFIFSSGPSMGPWTTPAKMTSSLGGLEDSSGRLSRCMELRHDPGKQRACRVGGFTRQATWRVHQEIMFALDGPSGSCSRADTHRYCSLSTGLNTFCFA